MTYTKSWICCQIGAREHYAVPRTLNQAGCSVRLVTDAWVPSGAFLTALPGRSFKSLKERYHSELSQASVQAFTGSSLRFELAQKVKKTSGWDLVIARNNWFQHRAVEFLRSLTPQLEKQDVKPILFAYSYGALEIVRYCKAQGWHTILGQIDPGPVEEEIVKAEHTRYPNYQSRWKPAPPDYWKNWHEECLLADRIIVNSPWSSQALQQAKIPAQKIDIVPLAYQPPAQAEKFCRAYPPVFSNQRPLRVLFLGQVILRKGIVAVLEASKLLQDQPIEFWIIGSQGITLPKDSTVSSKVHWMGSVPRSAAAQYYQMADVFLFPTLSDGFGLTQLEAQAWKLPIICSQRCGEVVKDGNNGIRLSEVGGPAIAQVLKNCLKNPQNLASMAEKSSKAEDFSLTQLGSYFT